MKLRPFLPRRREEDEERRGGAGPLLVRGAGPTRAGRFWADFQRVTGIRFSPATGANLAELSAALSSPGVLAAAGLSVGLAIAVFSGGPPPPPGDGPGGFPAPPAQEHPRTPESSVPASDAISMFQGANSLPIPEAPSGPGGGGEGAGGKDPAADGASAGAEAAGTAPGRPDAGPAPSTGAPADKPVLVSRFGSDGGPRFVMGSGSSGASAPSAAKAGAAAAARAAAGLPAAGRSYNARTTDPRSARSLSASRARGRSGPSGRNAFSQLRFADNRSRYAAAGLGETSRYQAAEAFDGKGSAGTIGGTGAGAGLGGAGVSPSPSPSVPIRSPAEQPAPAVHDGKNKTSYQQQMRMAIGLLAVSAILIAIAALLRMAADSNPLAAPMMLAFAQIAAGIGAALGAAAGAIGMWLMSKMGQNAQGTLIIAAGAALTALGAKVAIDSAQAAQALKDGGPIADAKAAASASAAQNIPGSFSRGVVNPSAVTGP